MTAYSRGDVVLVGFLFSDESGKKFLFGDDLIADWKGAGLLFPSDMEAVHRELRRSLGL